MKIRTLYFVPFVISIIHLAGCGDVVYPIWDFLPSNVGIIVKHSGLVGGQNLLDPAYEDNILDDEITAEYNGEIYELNYNDVGTRFIPARWHGLSVGKYYGYDGDDGTLALLFGEFQTEKHEKSHPETFTIHWGDGTSDEITFDVYVTYRKKGTESTVHRKIWLNGELQSDNSLVVEIVK